MKELIFAFIMTGIVVLFFSFLFCFGFIMEARSFNKFSEGKKATFIDAMFIELRVEACK